MSLAHVGCRQKLKLQVAMRWKKIENEMSQVQKGAKNNIANIDLKTSRSSLKNEGTFTSWKNLDLVREWRMKLEKHV